MSAPTTLYRFFDAGGELLYVGITAFGPQRWTAHSEREWWSRVARITTEHYPDRESAGAAEVRAIQAEHPLFNLQHARPPKVRPPRVYRRHGEGSVVLRTDGRWQVAFMVDGRRRYWAVRDEAGARLILACLQGRNASGDARRKARALLEAQP